MESVPHLSLSLTADFHSSRMLLGLKWETGLKNKKRPCLPHIAKHTVKCSKNATLSTSSLTQVHTSSAGACLHLSMCLQIFLCRILNAASSQKKTWCSSSQKKGNPLCQTPSLTPPLPPALLAFSLPLTERYLFRLFYLCPTLVSSISLSFALSVIPPSRPMGIVS